MTTKFEEATSFLRTKGIDHPEIGIVLGTGLHKISEAIETIVDIPYASIPNFPLSTVESHSGMLTYGTYKGKKVLLMKGRFHFYEGYNYQQIVFPIRVMKLLGIKTLLLSNTSGCINLNWKKGELMLLDDHINLHIDNPLIGKIINGTFNNDIIEPNSNFWFDNFIGCNNFFISEYYWFVILNDDWLIYILFYGKYENINSQDIPKVLFIKNRKNNKIYNCSPGVSSKYFRSIDNIIHPIHINYKSNKNKKVGEKIFDEYEIKFISNELTIDIKSIPTKSVRTLLYDYYNDQRTDSLSNLNEWDMKYKNVLNNLKYVEYINKVDVEIKYENVIEKFETDQIIDAVFPNNSKLHSTIKWE
jgi:hypothetical protein